VTPAHRQRAAVVYVRQSTLLQLERNKESTARQYDLVERAVVLGWSRAAIGVVDEDQGHSGSSTAGRSGFAELAARIGLGQVGIVLALEVSRLARNNADWYRLLDLAAMTDTRRSSPMPTGCTPASLPKRTMRPWAGARPGRTLTSHDDCSCQLSHHDRPRVR
jgi:hypothetical protein